MASCCGLGAGEIPLRGAGSELLPAVESNVNIAPCCCVTLKAGGAGFGVAFGAGFGVCDGGIA